MNILNIPVLYVLYRRLKRHPKLSPFVMIKIPYMPRTNFHDPKNVRAIKVQLQSNLVISNSLISNYRLSRSENLVPVLT